MIVDALVYAGDEPLRRRAAALRAARPTRAAAGLDRLVAAPAKPRDYDLAGASERLAEECAASGGRAVCLARLDPWQDDAPDAPRRRCSSIRRCAACCCTRGRRRSRPTPSGRVALAAQAAARGCPVVVEAGHPLVAEALSLADLARRVDGTVVMTRGGQVNMAGLAQQSADLALEAAPNLCALSAGMYRQDWLESCVRQFGAAAAAARLVRAGVRPRLRAASARATRRWTMTSARPCSAATRWRCSD